jgi:flagellar biosynthesis protein FlhG
LADLDLGGANLHTLMGIKNPERTLNDFISKRFHSLEDICIQTETENLRAIFGAGEVLSMANPHYAQKIKIIKNLKSLDVDYILLDLGAGSSFDVLDFFLLAEKQIIVMTPEPTSIQNAYAFIRNAAYRLLNIAGKKNSDLWPIIKKAADPRNEMRVLTISQLFQVVEKVCDREIMLDLKKKLGRIKPAVVTNMVRNLKDKNISHVVKAVAEQFLTIKVFEAGHIMYDRQIPTMTENMIPLSSMDPANATFVSIYDITERLVHDQRKNE